MVQFFYCEKGEPTVHFCLIGALVPTHIVFSSKSKTTFFYSNLNLKKERKKGGHKSLLALSARSYQKTFQEEMAQISSQLWMIYFSHCLLKVWPWWHDYSLLFTYLNNNNNKRPAKRWGLPCNIEKCYGTFCLIIFHQLPFVGDLVSVTYWSYKIINLWKMCLSSSFHN